MPYIGISGRLLMIHNQRARYFRAHARRSDAEKSALKNCAQPGCWAYTFQTGYGGIAMADDGSLYGAWSARGEESAGR